MGAPPSNTSLMASSRLLSSSVSWPSTCKRTCRPSDCERSRTMRGILVKMLETGCIRAFITDSRRSAVTISRRRLSMVILGSDEVACRTWLRVSTSSPTRFIILLSRVTSTRSELSAAELWLPGARCLAASPSESAGALGAEASTEGGAAGWAGAGAAATGSADLTAAKGAGAEGAETGGAGSGGAEAA